MQAGLCVDALARGRLGPLTTFTEVGFDGTSIREKGMNPDYHIFDFIQKRLNKRILIRDASIRDYHKIMLHKRDSTSTALHNHCIYTFRPRSAA